MYLENVVVDAVEPGRIGRFWEAALGTAPLTDEEAGYETRLDAGGGCVLDLCFPTVPAAPPVRSRLHLDLLGGPAQSEVVARLLALGATAADIGQHDVPWVVLADPAGSPFCVMEERAAYVDTGPIAAMPFEVADPDREVAFWAWLTGWTEVDGVAPRSLRHPSRRGPLLELCPEREPKGLDKNPVHLDIRLERGDDRDAVAAGIVERGGAAWPHDPGDLPWRIFTDPSGNEFCVLPAS